MIKTEGQVNYIEDAGFTYFWFKVPGYKYYFIGSANVMEGPRIEDQFIIEDQLNVRLRDIWNKALKNKREELARFEKDTPLAFK